MLIERLREIVGRDQVLTDAQLVAGYTTDWTGRFGGPALAVVRPANADEVAGVLVACGEAGESVLPQGGNTGLVGGSVPAPGARPPVVLSTRRLSQIGEVDRVAGQVRVGAGALLADVRHAATAAGWEYGIDLAARDSATIGGTIATNAGGIRVCAYGMTRAQVVGVEAVLADGSVVSHLAGLTKDNTGYDLTGLFVGSEGTLGVITAAQLRLHPAIGKSTLALVGINDYLHGQQVLALAGAGGQRVRAAEVVDRLGTQLVCDLSGLPWPLSADQWEHLLIVEVEGDHLELPADCDAVVAGDKTDYQRLWAYRELQTEAAALLASRLGVTISKLDVSVPQARLNEFARDLDALLTDLEAVHGSTVFGHLADGNLHVEIAGPEREDAVPTREVLQLVARHGGSISAEHGVGRAKAEYLGLTRTESEIEMMRAIKLSVDPHGVLAPGVIFAVSPPPAVG